MSTPGIGVLSYFMGKGPSSIRVCHEGETKKVPVVLFSAMNAFVPGPKGGVDSTRYSFLLGTISA